MTFFEAQQQLDMLLAQQSSGALSTDAFVQAVNNLRVLDDAGRWWQPSPDGQGWIYWDGTAWQPGVIPTTDMPPIVPETTAASSTSAIPLTSAATATIPARSFRDWVGDVKQNVGSQMDNPMTFLNNARNLPLRGRPESWWNALSIFGGAGSGYLWFVYGSVSGFPTPAFLSNSPLGSYARFIMPLLLLLIPILLLIFRKRSATLLTGIQQKFSRLSLAGKIAVFAIPIGLLYFLPGISAILLRIPFLSRLAFLRINFGEGLDFLTPLMMVGLPIAFIYLRRPIDKFLTRFSFLQQIPSPLRIGLGLALPFLTAYLLFWIGFSEYPLLRANVLLGTTLSYLIVRKPRLLLSGGNPPGFNPSLSSLMLFIAVVFLVLVLADPSLADCFLTDPFNFNDGLRTNGVAPILAGISTCTVSILVNGVEMTRVVLKDTAPVKEGEEAKNTRFWVKAELQDAKGQRSSLLSPDIAKPLFLFAHCENEQGPFPAGDPTINMAVSIGQDWTIVTEEQVPGHRCWRLLMPDPQPKTPAPQSVEIIISAGQGGNLISVPVHLSLDLQTIMRVEMVNGNTVTDKGRTYTGYEAWTDQEKKGWNLGEMVIFWCKREDTDTVINTGYNPFEWTLVAKPDYLDFSPAIPTSDDGNLTWRTRATIKSGMKIPDDWLASDGVIEVKVTCRLTPAP